MPSISYRSFVARTSFMVATVLSDFGFGVVDKEGDEGDAGECEGQEDDDADPVSGSHDMCFG